MCILVRKFRDAESEKPWQQKQEQQEQQEEIRLMQQRWKLYEYSDRSSIVWKQRIISSGGQQSKLNASIFDLGRGRGVKLSS
jgi:hypothetical protein